MRSQLRLDMHLADKEHRALKCSWARGKRLHLSVESGGERMRVSSKSTKDSHNQAAASVHIRSNGMLVGMQSLLKPSRSQEAPGDLWHRQVWLGPQSLLLDPVEMQPMLKEESRRPFQANVSNSILKQINFCYLHLQQSSSWSLS